MDRRTIVSLVALGVIGLRPPPVAANPVCMLPLTAEPEDSVASMVALYHRFWHAQNARDLRAVRAELWESPDFLWLNEGRAAWGPEALLAGLRAAQEVEVWRVEPVVSRLRVVPVAADAAQLTVPVDLVVGRATAPGRARWQVAVLGRHGAEGWRIAALFATRERRD